MLSALWPVGYDAARVSAEHPLAASSPALVSTLWDVVVVPSFALFQLLWVVGLVARWRTRTAHRQLAWLVAAVSVSAVALLVGLAVAGSPRAGLLTAPLVPVAAGLAIVHGQHAAAYSALSWLSRSGAEPRELPAALARATAEALRAGSASVWLGPPDRLHAVGLWPETGAEPAPDDPRRRWRPPVTSCAGWRAARSSYDRGTGCPAPRSGSSTTSPGRPRWSSTTSR